MKWRELVTGCVVILACWLVDFISKQVFFVDPLPAEHFSFFGGLFSQINYKNVGITFSLPVPQMVIIVVTLLVLGFIVWRWSKAMAESRWLILLSLSILIGGAIGNLLDRILLGYVRDWMLAFHRSAFNLADVFIALGFLGWIGFGEIERIGRRDTASRVPRIEQEVDRSHES